MKTTLTVLFTSWMVLLANLGAETFHSLNGYRSTLDIPAGETALIINATSKLIVEIENKDGGKQYRFENSQENCGCFVRISGNRRALQNIFPIPSRDQPIYVAGPAKLTLRTSGFLTVALPESRRRNFSSSSSEAPRRFASR